MYFLLNRRWYVAESVLIRARFVQMSRESLSQVLQELREACLIEKLPVV